MNAHHRHVTDRIRQCRHAVSFEGPDAVKVYQLSVLASSLRFEIRCPGMRVSRHVSALQAAKKCTGLKTNDLELQLDRVERLLENAKRSIIVVDEQEVAS